MVEEQVDPMLWLLLHKVHTLIVTQIKKLSVLSCIEFKKSYMGSKEYALLVIKSNLRYLEGEHSAPGVFLEHPIFTGQLVLRLLCGFRVCR